MDRNKKIKNVRTEVVDGEIFVVYEYTDGSKGYKFVEDRKVNNIIANLMSENEDDNKNNLKILKGGKK